MILTVIMVAAFLSVETRLAGFAQLSLRARLNGVVALRLALAHTQQEAGPRPTRCRRQRLTQPDVDGRLEYPTTESTAPLAH